MNEITEMIQPLLLTLIEGVVAALVPLLLWKLNAWAKAKVHNAKFHCAMDKISTLAQATVLDVSQTYVKGVRKSGSWNGEAAKQAKERGRAGIRKLFGPMGLKELKSCLKQDEDGMNGILDGALEHAVVLLKSKGMLPKGGHATVVPAVSSER